MPTADLVLSRFPRHLDLDQPGKAFGEVVGSLATPLDSQITQNGKLRRTHRSAEVEQRIDLLRLGALHAFDDQMLVPVQRRVDRLAGLDLGAAAGPARELLGLAADQELSEEMLDAVAAYDAWLAIARRTLTAAIADQRHRSTTVAGVLGATADYLGFELVSVHDDEPGGFWHLARCRDRIQVASPDGPVPAGRHLLALEENPPFLSDLGPIPRRHADRFHVTRHGFETVPCTVIVKGLQDRTLEPMIVNLDEGEGLVTTVAVPDGSLLRFERDGRVELDGASVARRSYTFSGAVFAPDGGHPLDFVFADADDLPEQGHGSSRIGHFVVTGPLLDAFDPAPSFPHGDGLLRPLRLDRSETRYAVFVGAGVFGGESPGGPPGTDVLAAPEPIAGRFDETVFLPDPGGERSFEIGFEWDEREAYAVRVWLPQIFAELDLPQEPSLREVVRLLLDRHRAAGVHVYVDYADPRWVLGTGILRDLASDDALGVVVAGTQAWLDDTGQPE